MSRLLRAGLLGLLLAVALLTLGPGQAQTTKGKKYALLVGVSYYRNVGYPPLRGTENDVVELAKILEKPSSGFSVRLLTSTRGRKNDDDAPTAANIRKELTKLLKDKGREDTVLIAFAGHGADITVPDPDKKLPANTYTYFLPTDADELEDISHSTGHSDKLIELGDVFKRLEAPKCGAGSKLVLIDACRESLKAKSSVRSLTPTHVTVPTGVSALFSCGPGELALETGFDVGEEERRIHGVFFYHVIEGLKGEAANRRGTINWADLTSYVQAEVPAFVEKLKKKLKRKVPQDTPQNPHAILNLKRQVVLVEKEKFVEDAKEITNSIGTKLVRIEPGSFRMGSPESDKDESGDKQASADELPRHRVTISKAFYLGKYPVTVGEFRKFVEDAGYQTEAEKDGQGGYGYNATDKKLEGLKTIYTWKNPGWRQTESHPVVNVTWNDAVAFCKWLSKKEGKEYELPTEAQWEYACRAGTTTWWYSGNEPNSLKGIANIADSSLKAMLASPFGSERDWDDGYPFTSPVGKFKANPWNLFDMHGNVWQWCKDGPRTYDKEDKRDPESSKTDRCVLRGGSWDFGARHCRAAFRGDGGVDPGFRGSLLGFRVVFTPRTP